jgi:soluble lytic murein transglycosylase-like protein
MSKSAVQRLQMISLRDCLMVLLGAAVVTAGVTSAHWAKNRQVPLGAGAAQITIPWLPATVKHWQAPITEMAKRYNIDPNVLAIIMTMESGGYAQAKSEAGAIGLMQVTPPTAKDIASKYLKKPQHQYNLQDPRTNIEFGAAYLAFLRHEFGQAAQGPSWNSTVELIAAGYNGGPGAAASVDKGEGLHDEQTVAYSRDAFNMWRERHAKSSPTFDRWKERGGTQLLDLAKAAQAKKR